MNNKRLSDIEIEIMNYAAGGMTGYANGGGVGSMMKPKRVNFRGGGSYQGGRNSSDRATGGQGSAAAASERSGNSGGSSDRVSGDQYRAAKRDFVQTLNNNNAIAANQAGTKFEPYRGGSRPKDFFAPNGGLSNLTRNINPMNFLAGLATGNPIGILASLFNKGFKGLKGLNSKLQNSDFGQSKTLVDYFNRKKNNNFTNTGKTTSQLQAEIDAGKFDGNSMPETNVIMPGGPQYNLDNFGTGIKPSGPGYELSGFQQPTTIRGGINSNDFDIGRTNQNDFFGVQNVDRSLTSNQIDEFGDNRDLVSEFTPDGVDRGNLYENFVDNRDLVSEFGDNRNINMDEFATQNNIDNRLMQEYLTDQAGFQQPITASQIDEFGDNRDINMNEFAGNDIQMQNYLTDQANYNADPLGNPNMDPRVVSEEYGLVGNEPLPANDIFAFNPGSIKDRQLKQAYGIYEATGMEPPNLKNLMQEDIDSGGQLSLPENAYSMIG
jgi:hypothetical protein